jgi:hypothetical protein
MRGSLNPYQLRGEYVLSNAFYLVFAFEFPTREVNDLQIVNRLEHCLADLIFKSLVAFLQIR